ncbi:DNA-directed RNA polymerase subunit beta [subsurface metagenome]
MPHLLEIQLESYKQFISKTIKKVFIELFPITNIHNRYKLEYSSHQFGTAKYSVNEAIEKVDLFFEKLIIFLIFSLFMKQSRKVQLMAFL